MKAKIIRTILILSIILFLITNVLGYYVLNIINPSEYFDNVEISDNIAQLKNLKKRLEIKDVDSMQQLFPEGAFFSYILYGYSWINIGLQTEDVNLKNKAINESEWVLQEIDKSSIKDQFNGNEGLYYGVFYIGWKNRLQGGLIKLQGIDSSEKDLREEFEEQSIDLANAFLNSPTFYLEAYPGQSWPCDNIIALSSLSLHDELFQSDYNQKVIDKWVKYTKENILDKETGLIPHKINSKKGDTAIGPRGSSLVYSLSFLPEVDINFAKEQYLKFNEYFVGDFLGIPLVREYPKGIKGLGDVDSGPIIFGYAPVPTVVSISVSRIYRDYSIFSRNLLVSEMLGVPKTSPDGKSYLLEKLLTYDAFLIWGKTIIPWVKIDSLQEDSFDFEKWKMNKSKELIIYSLLSELIVVGALLILDRNIRKRRLKEKSFQT